MATVRARAQAPVGSAQWIADEHNLGDNYVSQEVEEFAFSARNEMEWLNEHMADVFNRQQFDVAEAFKTPGKLRGKTPRTARKRNLLEERAPLTDVFSATKQRPVASPQRKNLFSKQSAQFQVAEDKDDTHVADAESSSRFSFGTGKENTDSGYHDMTEDEVDVEQPATQPERAYTSPPKPRYTLFVPKQQSNATPHQEQRQASREQSQDTFVSAVEESNAHQPNEADVQDDDEATQPDEDVDETIAPSKAIVPEGFSSRQSNQYAVSASTAAALEDAVERAERDTPAHQSIIEAEDLSPSSDGSSPQRALVRKKSSLTFASLPAREPLATKKSVGARASHADQPRMNTIVREDNLGRQASGRTVVDVQAQGTIEPKIDSERDIDMAPQNLDETEDDKVELSAATKEHSKTSTQRLQERLALLGKSNASRPSKSIPSNATISQIHSQYAARHDANNQALSRRNSTREDNEESWIGPIKDQNQHAQLQSSAPDEPNEQFDAQRLVSNDIAEHTSQSEDLGADESKVVYPVLQKEDPTISRSKLPEKDVSSSRPQLNRGGDSTVNPPEFWKSDGPISASKAKLFSVFKSAKGIFASSASASAQAKMEALSSAKELTRNDQKPSRVDAELNGSLNLDELSQDAQPVPMNGMATHVEFLVEKHEPTEVGPDPPKRSSARLQTAQSKKAEHSSQDTQDYVPDVHAFEPSEPAASAQARANERRDVEAQPKSPIITLGMSGSKHDQEDMPPPPPPKSQFSGTQMHKGELRRPNRPPKDAAAKSGPAPVSIRLASQRIGQKGQPNAVAGTSHQEPMPPAVPPKQSGLSKKTSSSSLQTSSSTQSFKTTATSTSARPKALEAAARKKEQDDRETQRKAQQKRDMERRRAAKAEEERRVAQEQKIAEQRAQEAKQQAQKQALEQRKADALQRAEQQRIQAAAARSKMPEDFAPSNENDREQPQQNHIRSEASTIRPVSRMGQNQDSSRPGPHINPAKPPKRQFNPDDDYSQKPLPGRPLQQDQHPAKRRRTSEDSFAEVVSRPTMAPPVRPSMMRKENVNKYAQGFMSHPSSSHASTSMLKTTVNNQHQMQHPKTPHMNDLAKYSNARIPFAEAPNPPQSGPYMSQQGPSHQSRPQQPLKTPNSVAHKSSPQYPNGDSIDLPEIATDSEDSDDDDFVPPDWANSPALRDILKEQQLVDPMKVFGPIAPLMMEEVFKGNKERHAKFRNRTSSANWNGPDRLTEEERRRDREARERLEREGGWTFGGST